MANLPNKDLWIQVCTLKRLVRSVNSSYQEVEKDVIILQNEPCCFYQRNLRVLTPDGVVWKAQPRVTVSPDDGLGRPEIDDVFEIEGKRYKTTAMLPFTDYDGTYLGATCDLEYVGVAEGNE
jgi:hypothetical protein